MSSFASSAWNRQFLAGLLAVPQHKILWIPYGYAFHEVQMSHSHSKGSKIVVKRWYHLVLLLIKQVNTFGDNKTDTLSFTLWFGIKEHYPRLYVKSINLRDSNRRSPETLIDSCKSTYHTAQRFFFNYYFALRVFKCLYYISSLLSWSTCISAKESNSGFVLVAEETEIITVWLKLLLLAQLPTILGSLGFQSAAAARQSRWFHDYSGLYCTEEVEHSEKFSLKQSITAGRSILNITRVNPALGAVTLNLHTVLLFPFYRRGNRK